eukprot:scaffold871_cov130-Cylindrotheca_fusiformis.AAC.30
MLYARNANPSPAHFPVFVITYGQQLRLVFTKRRISTSQSAAAKDHFCYQRHRNSCWYESCLSITIGNADTDHRSRLDFYFSKERQHNSPT